MACRLIASRGGHPAAGATSRGSESPAARPARLCLSPKFSPLEVILVLFVPFDIHVPGIPVAVLRGRLRPPVGPDPEFGVPEPLRCTVLAQRLPGSAERPGRNRGDRGRLSFQEARRRNSC